MKKFINSLAIILFLAIIVAAFTVPSNEKLEQQLTTVTAGDTTKVAVAADTIKILGFLKIFTVCRAQYLGKSVLMNKDQLAYKVHYDTATKTFVSVPPDPSIKPIYTAPIIKVENYIGLFGTFWEYD